MLLRHMSERAGPGEDDVLLVRCVEPVDKLVPLYILANAILVEVRDP